MLDSLTTTYLLNYIVLVRGDAGKGIDRVTATHFKSTFEWLWLATN